VFWNVANKQLGFTNNPIPIVQCSFPSASASEINNIIKSKLRDSKWFTSLPFASPLRPSLDYLQAHRHNPPTTLADPAAAKSNLIYSEKDMQTSLKEFASAVQTHLLIQDAVHRFAPLLFDFEQLDLNFVFSFE